MVTLEQVDSDFYAKRRINKWMDDNADFVSSQTDDHDVSEVLLRFEKFLQTEEARRMKD